MKILITTRLPLEGFDALKGHELIYPENTYFTKQEVIDRLPEVEALVPTFDFPITEEMMKLAPNLKIIANSGAGFNNIDLEAATKRHIQVTNTPQPVITPTSEHCIALLFALTRRVAELDRKLRDKNETVEFSVMKNLGCGIGHKTLGILGMGRIGRALAKKIAAFDVRVVYHNRHQLSPEIEQELKATYLSKEEVIKQADFLSINMPFTPETRHTMTLKEFKLMKSSAFIINTARGPIIKEDDLVQALKTKEIAGAGIDVFEFEPKISPELLTFDNVVLTPHVATGTSDCRREMAEDSSRNILNFFSHTSPLDKVNEI